MPLLSSIATGRSINQSHYQFCHSQGSTIQTGSPWVSMVMNHDEFIISHENTQQIKHQLNHQTHLFDPSQGWPHAAAAEVRGRQMHRVDAWLVQPRGLWRWIMADDGEFWWDFRGLWFMVNDDDGEFYAEFDGEFWDFHGSGLIWCFMCWGFSWVVNWMVFVG